MQVDFEELIRTRRTVHSYTDRPVPLNLIETGLALCQHVPNHKKTRPQRFHLLTLEQKQKFLETAQQQLGSLPRNEILSRFFYPEIILLGQKRVEDETQKLEDYAALSCSVMVLSLYFHGHQLGSKWSTGKLSFSPPTLEFWGTQKEHIIPRGVLIVGVPG